MIEFGKEISQKLRDLKLPITDVEENPGLGGTVITIDHRIKVAVWEDGHWMGVALCDSSLLAHIRLERTQDYAELLSILITARQLDLGHVVDRMIEMVGIDEGPYTLH